MPSPLPCPLSGKHPRFLSICMVGLFLVLMVAHPGDLLCAQDSEKNVEKRPWKLTDARRFKSVSSTALSEDGKWLGTLLRASGGRSRRSGPGAASRRGRAATLLLYCAETGKKKKEIARVTRFQFTRDSLWVLYSQQESTPPETKKKEKKPERSERWKRMVERLKKKGGTATEAAPVRSRPSRTVDLTLEKLDGKKTYTLKKIGEYTFSEDGRYLFYVKSDSAGKNAIWVHDRKGMDPAKDRKIVESKDSYRSLSWKKELNSLWFYSNRDLDKAKPKAKPKPKPKAKQKAKPKAKQKAKAKAKREAKPKAKPEAKAKAKAKPKPKAVKKAKSKEKGKVQKPTTAKADEKKETPPARPTRLWSWSPGTNKIKPLVGPGTGKGFPEKQVLTGGSSGMARFFRGRSIPQRFLSRMRSMGSRGGGVTLSKDGKRLFVYTMEPRKPSSTLTTVNRTGTPGTTPRRARRSRMTEEVEIPLPEEPAREEEKKEAKPQEAEVVIWHWKDKLVPTEASKRRSRSSGRTLYEMDLKTGAYRKLSDSKLSETLSPDQNWLVSYDSDPYKMSTSWDQSYSDVYLRSVKTLKRKKLFTKFASRLQWTSDGKYMFWFEEGDWHTLRAADQKRLNLTRGSKMNLGKKGYGGGILMPDRKHLLLNDEFDVWKVSLEGKSPPRNLTRIGQRDNIRFRPTTFRSGSDKTDVELFFEDGQRLYLTAFNNQTKSTGFFTLDLLSGKLRKLVEMDRNIGSPRMAGKGDRIHFTVSDYDQYADVWVSDKNFENMRKITSANPWLSEIELPKNVLVEWRNLDGKPLQGTLTLPAGYTSGKRYPMIVYIYEKMSQNFHRFQTPRLVYNVPCGRPRDMPCFSRTSSTTSATRAPPR